MEKIAENGFFGDIPRVTTTVDERHRAVLKAFDPGDVLDIEQVGSDVVVLKSMKPAQLPKPKLVRNKQGDLVFVGGKRITNEDVRRMIEDEE
ncbi:MAG: hypothetical protein H0X66_08815 [Verrucomicrobia bacterium]|nr:hypothetical protein [Verrucomicrobiota bacterium]